MFARSGLKIASFEFANLQYFNFPFMNVKIDSRSRSVHVSDCFDSDKQNIVHLVSYTAYK